jgi:hypothetical protein
LKPSPRWKAALATLKLYYDELLSFQVFFFFRISNLRRYALDPANQVLLAYELNGEALTPAHGGELHKL